MDYDLFDMEPHRFKFYFIGDMNDRKNIQSVIRCFHSEFDTDDQVCLVIKINKFGTDPEQLKEHFVNMSNAIKQVMRKSNNINDYCPEVLITKSMSQNQIQQLHRTCDCLINISHGEAWSIPSFEAMAVGNTPICSDFGGPSDFIDSEDVGTGVAVGGTLRICNSSDSAFPQIFTGRESWFEPSEEEIKKWMRYYYENRDQDYSEIGTKRAEEYSYQKIGNQIKEYINE